MSAITYEEAKAHFRALQDKATRYQIERDERGKYLKSIGYDKLSDDVKYVMLCFLHEDIGREISAYKEFVKSFPEAYQDPLAAPHKKMWSGLSDPEKCALALLKMAVGEEQFGLLCKQGYELSKRRIEAAKLNNSTYTATTTVRAVKDKSEKREAYDHMMRGNGNTYGGKGL